MIALIRGWIIDIVVISILGVAADLILPNGNIKKYTRFLIGVIMLTVMLKPVFQMFNQMPDLQKYTTRNSMLMDLSSMNYKIKLYDDKQQEEIKDNFKKNLEIHIEEQIKSLTGYKKIKVRVHLSGMDENDRDPTGIESVYVEIGNGVKGSIQPVRIRIEDDSSSMPHSLENAEEERKIKGLISSTYGVNPDRIQVHYKPTDETELYSGQ